jgi:putative transposase
VANNEIELRTGSEVMAVDDSGMAPLAEGLVAAVRGHGVQLTASGGLLTGLTRQVLETALHVEMAEHLGYEHSDPSSHGGGNSRNGATGKTVHTDTGDVRIEVPGIGPARSPRLLVRSIRGGWPASAAPC